MGFSQDEKILMMLKLIASVELAQQTVSALKELSRFQADKSWRFPAFHIWGEFGGHFHRDKF
jgi:hypothetical protein